MTPFLTQNDSNQRTACTRSVRVSPHVCCQVYTSTKRYQVSVSNTVTEPTGFRSIPTSIHKYPCSVACHAPRCSIPSQHIPHQVRLNELPQNTYSINTPLGDDVCNDCAQRNETMLTSVTRDPSSRRRPQKAASSHEPNPYPYTACKPSALCSRGVVRILCPVVDVASSPPSVPQLPALQRFNSTCCQSHAPPAHLRYADPGDHHRALHARFHLDLDFLVKLNGL